MTERFCDVGRGITLCYEEFGDPSDPAALLIMGLSMQMIAWQEDFCRELAGRGLRVVRFDNRDVGRSTHMRAPAPTMAQLLRRSRHAASYTLAEMAEDTAGLLDELGLAPTHVIGASMGGMIAQTLAARHPRKVRSLVSIMSNTGSPWSGRPAPRLLPLLLRPAPSARDAFIGRADRVFAAIGSPGLPRDPDDVRALAAASYDRSFDPAGSARQLAAITASGDRTREVRGITAPTLVVHGTDDPLVAYSGGRATARAISGAKLMSIRGMGHDMPRAIWPRLIDAIAWHTREAEASALRPSARAAARATGDRPPQQAPSSSLSGLSG